jgi:NAD(P)-dependent dehydrogenase (short-subunit alcohol dehydrogenase family)
MRLAEQVAIVTGAARGIGKGIATELAREGARVALADVDEPLGRQTEKELRAEGATVSFRRCDVSDEQAVSGLVDAVVADWGRLDLLVNNAAIGVYKAIDQATADDFDRCLAVNLRGPFLCTKHAARAMRATSGTRPPGGSIVNIASVHSVQNVPGTVPYAASKGGVAALTRACALDLAADGIRVNAICPGWIDTPLVQGIFAAAPDPGGMRRGVEQRQPLKRLGTPAEIGRAVVFLASADASYVTGSLLFVDNGMTAQLETWTE